MHMKLALSTTANGEGKKENGKKIVAKKSLICHNSTKVFQEVGQK